MEGCEKTSTSSTAAAPPPSGCRPQARAVPRRNGSAVGLRPCNQASEARRRSLGVAGLPQAMEGPPPGPTTLFALPPSPWRRCLSGQASPTAREDRAGPRRGAVRMAVLGARLCSCPYCREAGGSLPPCTGGARGAQAGAGRPSPAIWLQLWPVRGKESSVRAESCGRVFLLRGER